MSHTTLATQAAALLLDISLKSLPILATASLACLPLRRASAAARHALWLLVLAGLLCLPVFCALLPQWSAPVLPAVRRSHVVEVPAPIVAPESQEAPSISHMPPSPTPVPPAAGDVPTSQTPMSPVPAIPAFPAHPPVPNRLTPTDGMCLIWLTGTLLILGRTLFGLAAASRLVRRCRPATNGTLVEAADDAQRALGLTRPLTLRIGEVAVPMTCGVRRPVILLPRSATGWPADRLRAVLLHEAAHVQRLDWATMVFAHCVRALYWFHPLVWLAVGRLRAEAEGACDDLVLSCGVPAPDYAAHLLEIVRGLTHRRQSLTGTVAMAHQQEVAGRLRMILDGHKARGGVSRRRMTVAALVAVVLLAPLAALRPVASSPPRMKHYAQAPTDADVPPALSAMMAGQSRWEVRLPNGVRVRLLSVSESPAGATVTSAWEPDGTPEISTQRAWPMPSVPGARVCKFTLGIIFPADGLMPGASIWYGKVGEQEGTGGNQPPEDQGRATIGGYGEWFPVSQTQAALQVSIAMGPKVTLIDAPAGTGAVRRLPTGETVSVSPLQHRAADVAHEGGQLIDTRTIYVTLPARFVHDMSEYELQTIGANGKPFTPAHSGGNFPQVSGKTARLLYTYRTSELQINRVKGFRFTYRPSYTAIFRNVALRPAASPNLVSPDPQLGKAMTFPNISLSNLRQIGFSLVQYAADHHEHFPDAAHWMDAIIPYLVPRQVTGTARQQRITALFHDPAAPAGQTWSYAYNRALSGLSLAKVDFPSLTIAVFESTQGAKNASDSGQSVPIPGWHSGGTDFGFVDGHTKWLRDRTEKPPFRLMRSAISKAIAEDVPVYGRIYDGVTHKPIAGTFVIFSGSPNVITPGSVWPSSFTDKEGHFQSYLHPGKNYVMVLIDNRQQPFRFRLLRGIRVDVTSGNTEQNIVLPGGNIRVSLSPPGRTILLRPALSSSLLRLSVPNAYGEVVEDTSAGHTQIIEFAPVKRVTR